MTEFDGRRILVIDDEPSIHADFRSVLAPVPPERADARLESLEASMFGNPQPPQRSGFDLSSAYQGEEGLELARSAIGRGKPFAVAFVDMRMPPGWDGMRTVKELLRLAPAPALVVCTAYSDHSWKDLIEELAAQDRLLVIKKPFDPIEVWQAASVQSAHWLQASRTEATIATLRRQLAECRSRLGPADRPSTGQ